MRACRFLLAALVLLAAPSAADAFCGFYVSGADGALYNNATQVVMMRSGTKTVLSMQNSYQGPPSDFAMVVPVPVVLKKENVKTLPAEIFQRVDKLGAPRLVEYWEQDPCMVEMPEEEGMMALAGARALDESAADDKDGAVKIEAQFTVGEYEVVVLSATESTALDRWLKQNHYKIPDGAAPYLEPYVASGSKFFVAKVDVSKVKFVDGRAMLSPLRFHYDTNEFRLPIRLGMMNSSGTQDLIVNILAPGQRYEVANYPNVTIPTNLDVRDEARTRFGEFYAALFDRTVERNKGAVVTEYSWDAGSCDPCPEPALDQSEIMTLGGDVVGGDAWSMVLTRLHARYGKDGGKEDLVFKAAAPIAGGREWRGADGKLEERSQPAGNNNFQGRYAIRHEWTGAIACENPRRGIWGGPPDGHDATQAATDLAFVPRGKVALAKMVRSDVPEIGLVAKAGAGQAAAPTRTTPPRQADAPPMHPAKQTKGCQAGGGAGGFGAGLLLLMVLALARRREGAGRK